MGCNFCFKAIWEIRKHERGTICDTMLISKLSGVAEVLLGVIKADYWDVNKMFDDINSLLKDEDLRKQVVRPLSAI